MGVLHIGGLDHSDSLGGIVCLRVCDVLVMTFSRCMIILVTGVYESFVSDEEVAAGKGLGTDVADEGLLLGVSADVSLEMLLQAVSVHEGLSTAEGGWGDERGTNKPCKETLAVRTRKGLGFVARLFSLDPTRGC